MTRKVVDKVIQGLPESFNVQELIDRLLVISKVEEAQESIAAGLGIPHQQVEEEMKNYMKRRRDEENNMVSTGENDLQEIYDHIAADSFDSAEMMINHIRS